MTPLEAAITQIGIVEEDGNRGLPFERYAIKGEDPLPWCARYVRWCFDVGSKRLPGNKWLIGEVRRMYEALDEQGAILPKHAIPTAGDIIFTHRPGGWHVGIVEKIVGVVVTSIEGNVSDRVKRVERPLTSTDIIAFSRW